MTCNDWLPSSTFALLECSDLSVLSLVDAFINNMGEWIDKWCWQGNVKTVP